MKASAKVASGPGPGLGGGVLVSPQWLEARLGNPGVRVVEVDVSPAAYNDWHIDGAVLWNIYADLKDADYRLRGTAALERLVARSGIRPDSTVVFYGYAPALALWLMKLYGHRDVRILDCSRDNWLAEGRPRSTAVSEQADGGYHLGDEDLRIRADQAAVLEAIGQPGAVLTRLAPLRESGYRYLMQALAAQGNLAEALSYYGDLSQCLRDQLGVSPSPATRTLYEQLLGTT